MIDASPEMLSIFCVALERLAADERAAYLDAACGKDAELRARIEELLRAHEAASGFLPEQPVTGNPRPTSAEPLPQRPGVVVGPYKLLQQIGEGGMGTVFMAEQTQPVQRRVALKIIKPGMDSRQVIARFEAERQALALMDHPHIARVFDAGTTDGGRPYFVMELVKGVPITTYCDEHHLTPRERLELFVPVCQAVQHAHQKGIIHRDLKPSNVLVALYDGKPVPKVIDFGIAKATGPKLTEKTLFTEFGAIVGTLEYMSPEQAELNQLDIDTRSDIYALGVLLYELLTGTTPLEKKRLKVGALLESLRIIREEEPPRPSARLSTTEELPSIAVKRGLEPKKLSGLVRGELDWIVMKCLEKDRDRRYETANGLARDLERYLHDEPVLACPPSAWYRFCKFARRNKPALATAGLVALVLILGALISTWQAVRATHAEELAGKRLEAEKGERERAVEAEGEAQRAAQRLGREKRQAQISLSTFLLDKGLDRCEQGEVGLGMLWLARSLEKAPDDAADLQRVIRMNLASWRHRMSPLKAVLPHQGAVQRVAFSQDGRTILTVSEVGHQGIQLLSTAFIKGEVRRWDAVTGKPLGSPIPHQGPNIPTFVAFSPDGKMVLTGRDRQTAQLWDLDTGRPRGSPLAHPSALGYRAVFSADSRTVLTTTLNTAHLWETATGKPLGKPLEHADPLTAVALSPDGRIVLTGRGWEKGSAQLWKAATGKPLGPPLPFEVERWITAAAFSPDGRFVLTAGDSRSRRPGEPRGAAQLWEVETGKPVGTPLRPQYSPSAVSFSPDGRVVVMGHELWNVEGPPGRGTRTRHGEWGSGPHLAWAEVAVFSPDGRTVLTGGTDGALPPLYGARLWRRDDGDGIGVPLAHPQPVRAVAFSPDGRTLLTGCQDGTARLWEMATPQKPLGRRRLGDRNMPDFIAALSPDGKALLRTLEEDWAPLGPKPMLGPTPPIFVEVQNLTAKERIGVALEVNGLVTAAAFSPDGEWALVSTLAPGPVRVGPDGMSAQWEWVKDTTLWLWEGGAWKPTGPRGGLQGRVAAMAVGPGGRTVLLG